MILYHVVHVEPFFDFAAHIDHRTTSTVTGRANPTVLRFFYLCGQFLFKIRVTCPDAFYRESVKSVVPLPLCLVAYFYRH